MATRPTSQNQARDFFQVTRYWLQTSSATRSAMATRGRHCSA